MNGLKTCVIDMLAIMEGCPVSKHAITYGIIAAPFCSRDSSFDLGTPKGGVLLESLFDRVTLRCNRTFWRTFVGENNDCSRLEYR